MKAAWTLESDERDALDASDARFAEVLHGVAWLDEDRRLGLRLGLHELVVNVFRHGYGAGRAGATEVLVVASSAGVTVHVVDDGRAFSRSNRAPVPGEGGYGILIIEQVFDDVTYRRRERRSHWTLCAYPRPDDES